ncbi:MAG: DUF2155 domain-containing protein [Alphaproteobacteria bacterium]
MAALATLVVLVAFGASAADLRELLAQQASEAQHEENPRNITQVAQADGGDGFLNSLSDFLSDDGDDQPTTQFDDSDLATTSDDASGDDAFGDDSAFVEDVDSDATEDPWGNAPQHYDGAGLEPERSDMFDEAFSPNEGFDEPTENQPADAPAPAYSDAFDDAFGPAPDDAPEDYDPQQQEQQPVSGGDEQANGLDIFGKPKKNATVNESPDGAASDFKFDLSQVAPIKLDVPENTTVTVRALDKITARMSEHKLSVNTPYQFGTLAIILRTCTKNPPEETPEVTAYLEILDNRPDVEEENREWFRGWMFASSPAISALEHPVYDVWVIDCNIVSTSADGESR